MKDLFKRQTPDQMAGDLMTKQKASALADSRTFSPFKVYSLILISTVFAFGIGYLFSVRSFAYGTVVLLAFITIFIVQSLLIKGTRHIVIASLLNALGLSVFLYQTSLSFVVGIFTILAILFVAGHLSSQREVDNMIRLRFFRVVRPGIGLLLIALTIFSSAVIFINGDMFLEEKNIDRIVGLIGKPIFGDTVEDFSGETKLGDAIKGYATSQTSKKVDGFDTLSSYQKELAIRSFTNEFIASIESTTKYELQPEKSITQNIQNFITIKTEVFSQKTQLVRLVLLMLVLLFTVKSIEFLIHFPLALLGFIVYELLIAFGFIVIQFESRSKETLNTP
ncbi:MAG: hypothetical protein ABH880_00010 [Patescibacteria group bacterium]